MAEVIKYVVLYGANGVSSELNLSEAKDYAQRKANETGKQVEIDKLTIYSGAKPGQTDWSQTHYTYVKPEKKQSGGFGFGGFGSQSRGSSLGSFKMKPIKFGF